MALTLKDCRENLVDKYNVLGLQGKNIDFISVENDLNKYVVGDVLKTMCRAPSLNLFENIFQENSQKPIILQLTKSGEAYLKNNIDNMIKEYNKFNNIDVDDGDDFIFLHDIYSNNKDLRRSNGLASIVDRSDNLIHSFGHNNTFSSSPVHISGDSVHKRDRDKYIFR